MTLSIVTHDAGTGAFAAAVATRNLAVDSTVPHLRAGVVAHVKTDDGKIRNTKMLLAASENRRRCLDTSIRLHAALQKGQAINAVHDAVFKEIAKQSPEWAERIHRRLLNFAASRGS